MSLVSRITDIIEKLGAVDSPFKLSYNLIMRLIEARHPARLDAKHPLIVENLLEISQANHQEALNSIIQMLEDLLQNELNSRYAKTLQGTPIWELKTRSRGGIKGGARVYWFPLQILEGDTKEIIAVLVNAEVKPESKPNKQKLLEALEVYFSFKQDPITMFRRSS